MKLLLIRVGVFQTVEHLRVLELSVISVLTFLFLSVFQGRRQAYDIIGEIESTLAVPSMLM